MLKTSYSNTWWRLVRAYCDITASICLDWLEVGLDWSVQIDLPFLYKLLYRFVTDKVQNVRLHFEGLLQWSLIPSAKTDISIQLVDEVSYVFHPNRGGERRESECAQKVMIR